MAWQTLNAKSTRRIAQSTGLPIVRAWARGGYDFEFVTADHQHGTWNKASGQWHWLTRDIVHFSSCEQLFPQDKEHQ